MKLFSFFLLCLYGSSGFGATAAVVPSAAGAPAAAVSAASSSPSEIITMSRSHSLFPIYFRLSECSTYVQSVYGEMAHMNRNQTEILGYLKAIAENTRRAASAPQVSVFRYCMPAVSAAVTTFVLTKVWEWCNKPKQPHTAVSSNSPASETISVRTPSLPLIFAGG
ncbi:MAG TPA: hypothetical protein VLG71_02210 [Candidatus Limnocylindria bacterium]|nr:hypothetical protein [Candidatus Limnocylindria bacterium]